MISRRHQADRRESAALPGYAPAGLTAPALDAVAVVELAGIMRVTPPSLGRSAAEVLYSDSSWRPCRVVSWARIRGGRAVLIVWPDGAMGWYMYDCVRLHPV